jgi:hypothetical protein
MKLLKICKTKMIKKYAQRGLITGFILAVINTVTVGLLLGWIWMPISYPLMKMTHCSGEGCWGVGVWVGDLLFLILTPLIFSFVAYVKDKEYYPTSAKKILIISIIILVVFIFCLFAYMESAVETADINHSIDEYPAFNSLDECDKLFGWGPSPIGKCYGYFASQKNDASFCNSVENKYEKGIIGRNDFVTNCIGAVAVYKNDIKYCDEIKAEKMEKQECYSVYEAGKPTSTSCNAVSNYDIEKLKQNCTSKYYTAKGDCEKISNINLQKECQSKTYWFNTLVKNYMKLRGLKSSEFQFEK